MGTLELSYPSLIILGHGNVCLNVIDDYMIIYILFRRF